jgi:hypothetical protein
MREFFILIVVFLIINGCSPNLNHIRFNYIKNGFEATSIKDSTSKWFFKDSNWEILRDPITNEKIFDKRSAQLLLDSINNKHYKINNVLLKPKSSIKNQYIAGNKYFEGIRFIETSDYRKARDSFLTSLKSDPDLKLFSDIYMLLSICDRNLNNNEESDNNINMYLKYSESNLPPSFYLNLSNSDYDNNIISSHSLTRNHISNKTITPLLRPRYFPGFLNPVFGKPMMNINILLGYPFSGQNYIGLDLTLTSKSFWSFSWGGLNNLKNTIRSYFAPEIGIYKSQDNRFSTKLKLYLFSTEYTFPDKNEIKFTQISPNIEIGYFLKHNIGLFSGYFYNYWNEKNKYSKRIENVDYFVWDKNELYGGITLFVTDYIGITSRFGQYYKYQLGLYLYGSNIFPNFLSIR